MVFNALKKQIEKLYKGHKFLLIHLSIAILWPLVIWLIYFLFPNQIATRLKLSRAILIGICIQLLIFAFQRRRYFFKTIREFFTEETYPINLAIFRIVLFQSLFVQVNSSVSKILWFSQVPSDLLFPPLGLGWIIYLIPINATIAQITALLLKICSFTAMIGLFTRTSAWLSVILGVYVLGIPQLYGKVNHYHHLLWFAAILAASRCADVLSLDAIFFAWKRADRGQIEPPSLSRNYALPLRFVWLLMGIIYFFPGLYKLFSGGFDWAFSDNLKYQLYNKWLELDGWMPLFRLDKYPVLYRLSALGSIFFELSFIFLMFSSTTRYIAAVGGLLFHNMTNLLMKISFLILQKCYVAFLDWNAIFHWIGHRLFRKEMYVIYDGNCKLCRRTIATLKVFDIFGRLTFVNALDEQALTTHNLLWLDLQALLADMHVVVETKSWKAFSAYRVLATRIPILWPTLPLLYIWPVPTIGNQIYRRVADSRTCSLPQAQNYDDVPRRNYQPRSHVQIVTVVGTFLLVINIFFGLIRETEAWPFSCYPKFSGIANAQTVVLEIVPLSTTGTPIAFEQKSLKKKISPERFMGLSLSILYKTKDPNKKLRQLSVLWQLITNSDPSLKQAKSVQFYKTTVWNDPEKQLENPVNRSLVLELNV
ncbi:MAG: DUF393 domain-containing protein [Desmonostoc vinosum HA7617-LM4]|jgi:predicted DCC family thiol-disulfide oxidoreductase YuxK|nr:DUF393 domain-containing protein [Desmonostoc vinosum HA7617-LM4]